MARTSHLHAVPDEFRFEADDKASRDADPYHKTVTRAKHKFVYGASDDHGHSAQVNVRHPPSMAARVKTVAEHPATPYKSASAVWRDAIYWYLRFMEDWLEDDDFSEEMKTALLQSETDHHINLTTQRVQLVETRAQAILALLKVRDMSRLPELISTGREIVEQSTVDTSELERAIAEAERELDRWR